MIRRLLAADLRRTRSSSALLVGLIAVAVLLASLAASVAMALTGAIDRLFTDARTPDVVQMHAGELDRAPIAAWADANPDVEAWFVDTTVPVAPEALAFNGEPQTRSILQPALVGPRTEFDLLLDLDNQPLTPQSGEIALPAMWADDIAIGDKVTVLLGGEQLDFTVVAFLRDSTMNPTFVTSKRLLISAADHARAVALADELEHLIEFDTVPGAERQVADAYARADLPAQGPRLERSAFMLMNAMSHGLSIAVLLLLAGIAGAIAVLALRFSFLATLERDRREIAEMLAVGIPARRVSRIYLTKYALLAGIGGLLGLALTWPTTVAATAELRRLVGTAPMSVWSVVAPLAAAALVVASIIGWCALILRRLRHIPVVAAIRGQEPAARRWGLRPRLHRSPLPAWAWRGWNDVARGLGSHAMLFATAALCTALALIPTHLATTITSDSFASYLGAPHCDIRLELHASDRTSRAGEITDELRVDPAIDRAGAYVTARFDVTNLEGEAEQITVETGDHTGFRLDYLEGQAPVSPDELAVSTLVARAIGAGVGDEIAVTGTRGTYDVRIVGIYQDMTNGGRTAKGLLPTDGEPIVWTSVLADVTDDATVADVVADLERRYPDAAVFAMAAFGRESLAEMADQTRTVAIAASTLAGGLMLLITGLFVPLVLGRERSQIAISQALGLGLPRIRAQYLARFVGVGLAGIAVGVMLVATVGEWAMAGVLGSSLGAPALRFLVNPWLAYVAIPLGLTALVTLGTWLALARLSPFDRTHLTQE